MLIPGTREIHVSGRSIPDLGTGKQVCITNHLFSYHTFPMFLFVPNSVLRTENT